MRSCAQASVVTAFMLCSFCTCLPTPRGLHASIASTIAPYRHQRTRPEPAHLRGRWPMVPGSGACLLVKMCRIRSVGVGRCRIRSCMHVCLCVHLCVGARCTCTCARYEVVVWCGVSFRRFTRIWTPERSHFDSLGCCGHRAEMSQQAWIVCIYDRD